MTELKASFEPTTTAASVSQDPKVSESGIAKTDQPRGLGKSTRESAKLAWYCRPFVDYNLAQYVRRIEQFVCSDEFATDFVGKPFIREALNRTMVDTHHCDANAAVAACIAHRMWGDYCKQHRLLPSVRVAMDVPDTVSRTLFKPAMVKAQTEHGRDFGLNAKNLTPKRIKSSPPTYIAVYAAAPDDEEDDAARSRAFRSAVLGDRYFAYVDEHDKHAKGDKADEADEAGDGGESGEGESDDEGDDGDEDGESDESDEKEEKKAAGSSSGPAVGEESANKSLPAPSAGHSAPLSRPLIKLWHPVLLLDIVERIDGWPARKKRRLAPRAALLFWLGQLVPKDNVDRADAFVAMLFAPETRPCSQTKQARLSYADLVRRVELSQQTMVFPGDDAAGRATITAQRRLLAAVTGWPSYACSSGGFLAARLLPPPRVTDAWVSTLLRDFGHGDALPFTVYKRALPGWQSAMASNAMAKAFAADFSTTAQMVPTFLGLVSDVPAVMPGTIPKIVYLATRLLALPRETLDEQLRRAVSALKDVRTGQITYERADRWLRGLQLQRPSALAWRVVEAQSSWLDTVRDWQESDLLLVEMIRTVASIHHSNWPETHLTINVVSGKEREEDWRGALPAMARPDSRQWQAVHAFLKRVTIGSDEEKGCPWRQVAMLGHKLMELAHPDVPFMQRTLRHIGQVSKFRYDEVEATVCIARILARVTDCGERLKVSDWFRHGTNLLHMVCGWPADAFVGARIRPDLALPPECGEPELRRFAEGLLCRLPLTFERYQAALRDLKASLARGNGVLTTATSPSTASIPALPSIAIVASVGSDDAPRAASPADDAPAHPTQPPVQRIVQVTSSASPASLAFSEEDEAARTSGSVRGRDELESKLAVANEGRDEVKREPCDAPETQNTVTQEPEHVAKVTEEQLAVIGGDRQAPHRTAAISGDRAPQQLPQVTERAAGDNERESVHRAESTASAQSEAKADNSGSETGNVRAKRRRCVEPRRQRTKNMARGNDRSPHRVTAALSLTAEAPKDDGKQALSAPLEEEDHVTVERSNETGAETSSMKDDESKAEDGSMAVAERRELRLTNESDVLALRVRAAQCSIGAWRHRAIAATRALQRESARVTQLSGERDTALMDLAQHFAHLESKMDQHQAALRELKELQQTVANLKRSHQQQAEKDRQAAQVKDRQLGKLQQTVTQLTRAAQHQRAEQDKQLADAKAQAARLAATEQQLAKAQQEDRENLDLIALVRTREDGWKRQLDHLAGKDLHELKSLDDLQKLEDQLREAQVAVAGERQRRVKALQDERKRAGGAGSALCSVCLENVPNCALIPCGHLVCFDGCAPKLAQCPVCRRAIASKVRVFL